jgi:hypothetical protein
MSNQMIFVEEIDDLEGVEARVFRWPEQSTELTFSD